MNKAKILIVEDEVIAAEVTRSKLIQLGYQVPETVATGLEAIEKAHSMHPDLILMDIQLKGEMDGTQAAEQIREQLDIPIIFITAFTDNASIKRATDSEPLGYLIKPFRAEELRTTIEIALYKHQLDVKLRASENLFRNFVQQSSEGFILIDEEGIVIEWNQSAEQITGIPTEEIRQKPIWDTAFQFLPTTHRKIEDMREILKEMVTALRDGKITELKQFTRMNSVTYLHAKKTERYVQQRFFPIDVGSAYHLGGVILDITERIQTEKRLHYLATHDALTGLPNRSLFNDRSSHAIASARRTGDLLAILYLDLDGFKFVNDSYGHEQGDQLLNIVGECLRACIRETDTIARFGGDEFTICLENIKHTNDAATVAKKILTKLSEPFKVQGNDVEISVSIGISQYPQDGVEIGELLIKADTAMYRVKAAGKNNYLFYSTPSTDE